MTKKVYTRSQISEILRPVFRKHNVKRAVLFGSYADGSARETSDIDILVDSGLKGLAFFGLLEDVSESLDKPVDLIDTSQLLQGSEADSEIRKHGVVIY